MPTIFLVLATFYTLPADCVKLYDDIRIVSFAEQSVVTLQQRTELNKLYLKQCNEQNTDNAKF